MWYWHVGWWLVLVLLVMLLACVVMRLAMRWLCGHASGGCCGLTRGGAAQHFAPHDGVCCRR